MKNFLSLIGMTMSLFLLTACGTAGSSTASSKETAPQKTAAQETQKPHKVLVVYYSASGNTERIAKTIAQTVHGDLFKLVPSPDYSEADLNYRDKSSRVSKEHEDEALRNIKLAKTTTDHWAGYDTVFIGYPIWWGIAAWPVDPFVKANDFTGKKVIPFATSASSGLGRSGELLKNMAKGGDWDPGRRFYSGANDKEIRDWVKGLGL